MITATNSPVAENVRKIIQDKGLKQRVVAKKSGVDERILSDWLCGRLCVRGL